MRGGRFLLTSGLTAIAPTLWGSVYLVSEDWMPPDRPLLASTVRTLPAGLILLALTRQLPKGQWIWRALVLGALNIAAFNFLLFVAAERLPGGVAAMIMTVQPMIVLVLSVLFFKDRIRPPHLAACLLAVVGVALVVLKGRVALDGLGVAASLGASVCLAFGITLTKRWGRPAGVGLLSATGWQLAAGGLVSLPFMLGVEGLPGSVSGKNIAGFLYLILFGAVVSYALWFRGISMLPASAVSFLALCSPIVATVLGFVFRGETLSVPQLFGIAVILGAVLLMQPRPGRTPAPRPPIGPAADLRREPTANRAE
ncbi:EamA family transporter [Kitasatospora viridis]|uniref:Putative blue pigment (Indigoidine) exporter n=1 Tax=Kitasatospora viridis TaxID=281105 RepID=A0A561UKW7_9ACTN|nr:EamA family transporter [Kitasatospora viridis]TWG00002.1 putative blue pigment (indigoidine) exporter [Kitasatospora viridis]